MVRANPVMTVTEAIELVRADELLLPGIQRNFVWTPRKIAALFDSLLRGYPIGTLLLWETTPQDHPLLVFRRLVLDYTGREAIAPKARPQRNKPLLAVLDGQQRLTAFNLGLRGSYASSPTSPRRELYFDLDHEDLDAGSESTCYRFEFLSKPGQAGGAWFPVGAALGLATSAAALKAALERHGLEPTPDRQRLLRTLVRAITTERVLPVVIEQSSDLDRVLNIFARANTGGTPLTYVDLLVSTVTARWQQRNAADEIHTLEMAMNRAAADPFRFTADRIMKAGLVLLNVKQPKFHVDSFLSGNHAKKLEIQWEEIAQAMKIAAQLLASFGLSGSSLPAQNVVIPLAYYAFHRNLKPTYVTANAHDSDRRLVRAFVARTLLTRRYWTGAVDPVLVTTRDVIRKHGDTGFPLMAIENALRTVKPIDVTEDFVEELCELRYGDRRTLTLLSLLFPHMVLDGPQPGPRELEKDHIFPLSVFTKAALARVDLATDREYLLDRADLLPNLQLLRRADNGPGGKGSKLPKRWFDELGKTAKARYRRQGVKRLPDSVAGFEHFWQTRRSFLHAEIIKLLR